MNGEGARDRRRGVRMVCAQDGRENKRRTSGQVVEGREKTNLSVQTPNGALHSFLFFFQTGWVFPPGLGPQKSGQLLDY